MEDKLPAGMPSGFPEYAVPGRGRRFASSVFRETPTGELATEAGAVQWSSAAVARCLVAPKDRFALALMSQRHESTSLPYWPRFKQAAREPTGC